MWTRGGLERGRRSEVGERGVRGQEGTAFPKLHSLYRTDLGL